MSAKKRWDIPWTGVVTAILSVGALATLFIPLAGNWIVSLVGGATGKTLGWNKRRMFIVLVALPLMLFEQLILSGLPAQASLAFSVISAMLVVVGSLVPNYVLE